MNAQKTRTGRRRIPLIMAGFLCILALAGCKGARDNTTTKATASAFPTEVPIQPLTAIEAENGALYVEGPRLTVILNTFADVAEHWRQETVLGMDVLKLLETSPESSAQAAQSWTFEAVAAGEAILAFTPLDGLGAPSGPGYRFTFTVDADLKLDSDAPLFDLTGTRVERAQGEDAIQMVEEIDEALREALTQIVSTVYETPAEAIEITAAPYTHVFSGAEILVYTALCADGRSCDLAVDAAGTYYIHEGGGAARFKVILTGDTWAIGSPIMEEPSWNPDDMANKLAGVLFDGKPARPADARIYVDHRAVRVYEVGNGSGAIALDEGGEHIYCDPDATGTYYRVRVQDEPPVYRVDLTKAVTVDILE